MIFCSRFIASVDLQVFFLHRPLWMVLVWCKVVVIQRRVGVVGVLGGQSDDGCGYGSGVWAVCDGEPCQTQQQCIPAPLQRRLVLPAVTYQWTAGNWRTMICPHSKICCFHATVTLYCQLRAVVVFTTSAVVQFVTGFYSAVYYLFYLLFTLPSCHVHANPAFAWFTYTCMSSFSFPLLRPLRLFSWWIRFNWFLYWAAENWMIIRSYAQL